MKATEQLRNEHEGIKLMMHILGKLSGKLEAGEEVDPEHLEKIIEFFRVFADKCHHGKEEDILFRDLGQKALDPALAEQMRELVLEHEWARATTRSLVSASASLVAGSRDSGPDVRRLLGDLAAFYPKHIEKEDKNFFRASMAYLTPEERETMLAEFARLDTTLIHEKYRGLVRDLEAGS